MSLSKTYMIGEIKKHKDKFGQPYSRIKVRGGSVPLESAPEKNIYGMYVAVCLTGRRNTT